MTAHRVTAERQAVTMGLVDFVNLEVCVFDPHPETQLPFLRVSSGGTPLPDVFTYLDLYRRLALASTPPGSRSS